MSYVLNASTRPPITLYLDSRFGNSIESDGNGNSLTTNYTYNLSEPINVENNQNILLQLNSATIPYSFYNIRTGVNDIVLFNYTTIGNKTYDYVILDNGNYTANTLAFSLKTKINAVLAEQASALNFNISINYDRTLMSFYYKYTSSNPFITDFNFDFTATAREQSAYSSLNLEERTAENLIGCRSNGLIEVKTGVNSANAKGYIGSQVVDINDNIHGLYLRQNLSTKQTLDNSTGTLSNILERIPITTNAGGVIFYNNENGHKTMIDTNLIQTLGIRLTDDRHRSIDLNGLHFQISLVLSFIYKEPIRVERNKFNRRIMENALSVNSNRIPINNKRELKIKEKSDMKKK